MHAYPIRNLLHTEIYTHLINFESDECHVTTAKNLEEEKKLRTVEKRLVDLLTNAGYLKGRSRKFSEITAHIYIHREVTQRLLRKLTGYSLGTISAALQTLEKQGVVHMRARIKINENILF